MIYLDHNATTELHPAVIEAMNEHLAMPLNASSIHQYGRAGKSVLEKSRKSIAKLTGIEDSFADYQITFTASGTEANNIVLSNFADGEIFVCATEHPSILYSRDFYKNITEIAVDENGLIKLDDLRQKLKQSKAHKKLVSVMLANNETGVIQDIKEISTIAHENGALMHSDMVQAIGKISVDMLELDIDFSSISGHKFGGPVGAAALIAKTKLHLKPVFFGGGQERGVRSGTENVPAIAGLGVAAEIINQNLQARINHFTKLRDRLEEGLLAFDANIRIAGQKTGRLPNTSLIARPGKESATQIIAFDMQNIAVSAGSACSSGKIKSSYVLSAMGFDAQYLSSAIRVSFGMSNTMQDVEHFLQIYQKING